MLLNHGLFQDRDISRITIGYIIEGFFLNVYLNAENNSEMYPGKDFYRAFLAVSGYIFNEILMMGYTLSKKMRKMYPSEKVRAGRTENGDALNCVLRHVWHSL